VSGWESTSSSTRAVFDVPVRGAPAGVLVAAGTVAVASGEVGGGLREGDCGWGWRGGYAEGVVGKGKEEDGGGEGMHGV